MFKENSIPSDIEVIHPQRHSPLLHLLMWPAALVVGGLVGMAAFYGAQSYRHDSAPVTTALAYGTAHPQPSVVPSAYVLLQGSTPAPADDYIATQADIPLPTATPKVVATAKPSPKPSPKATITPTPSASPVPKPSASPTSVVPPSPQILPTVTPASSATPSIVIP